MKDTYIDDMLEVIDATPSAYERLKERLLARKAEKENEEL